MGFFLLLAKVALETTSAPASQAYTERLFSVCRDLTAGKHNTQQAVRPIVGPPQYALQVVTYFLDSEGATYLTSLLHLSITSGIRFINKTT